MRERVAFRGEVETLTAEPKFSARVLASLPVVVYLGLRLFQPDFVRPLQTQPEGAYILAYAAASCFVGYLVMMKIADIEM
jgi:tight adherence protein B